MTYACMFTITSYGISGNEIPPPRKFSRTRAVLSGDEAHAAFVDRMSREGMAIRQSLNARFDAEPKPYSCADSCDWLIVPVTSITEITRECLTGSLTAGKSPE